MKNISKEKMYKILAYLQGNIRFYLYTSKSLWRLIPEHIAEQYHYRIQVVPGICIDNEECRVCGCSTPELFFANKSCDNFCYPTMQNRTLWNKIKEEFYGSKKDILERNEQKLREYIRREQAQNSVSS